MIDHVLVRRAMRARLAAIAVVTTGSIELSVTTAGYARVTGSFVADKFEKGMEVRAAGFGAVNTGLSVVTKVEPLLLTTRLIVVTLAGGIRTVTHPAHVAEALASGRTLSVGLPSFQAWENVGLEPEPGYPYVDEQYQPLGGEMNTIGPFGRLEGDVNYRPRINVPAGAGSEAADRYADAMVDAYPPGDVIDLGDNKTIKINAKTIPYRGQILPGSTPGFVGLLCTVPAHCYALNSQ